MKKQYVHPEIQVIHMEMQGCIAAGSLGLYGGDGNKMGGGSALSRDYDDVFEDEDW